MFYTATGNIRPIWSIKDPHMSRHPYQISTSGKVLYSPGSRVNQPCHINPDGYIFYANKYGRYHRTNGPAVIYADSRREYWINDTLLTPSEFFMKYGVL